MSQEHIPMETLGTSRGDDTFLKGVKDCIPTLLGYLSIGFAAGVVEKTAGLSIAEIALLSLVLYAGSAQFIAAGMIAAGGSASAIIITIFFVNLRHLLLSAALSPYFRHLPPFRNMLIGSLLTDETFGVAINETARRKQISERWMHGLNITAYLNWFVANLAGAYFGQWIANPEKYGLDFALPAMFIGLLVLSMISRNKFVRDGVVALSAVVLTVAISLVFGSNLGVIAATLIAATIGMVLERWK
ncbi:MAG TPA: AzlC family ABC transporter permease [Brevibacillus sp.]|nr:AzlC family ABC transporter permease [Brevibacillus sp.]